MWLCLNDVKNITYGVINLKFCGCLVHFCRDASNEFVLINADKNNAHIFSAGQIMLK